jgi:hypothetical protein
LSLALLLMLAAAEPQDDPGRHRQADFQVGEFQPEENDVLVRAMRPPMSDLGPDAVRFSTSPALGGVAYVVEIVPRGRNFARVTVLGLWGHERDTWTIDDRIRFNLAGSRYRALTSKVDAELTRARAISKSDETDGESYICTDGPGYLTERIVNGAAVSLIGFCDPDHPNRAISDEMLGLLCSHLGYDFPEDEYLERRCRRLGR